MIEKDRFFLFSQKETNLRVTIIVIMLLCIMTIYYKIRSIYSGILPIYYKI